MVSVDVKNRKAEQSATKRALLVRVARGLFGERGYAETSIEDIIQEAAVSRGALYHHYRDKEELFHAVYEQIQRELVVRIVAAGRDPQIDWMERIRLGLGAYMDWYMDPAMRQIVLLDAPSVMGWQSRYRAIDEIGLPSLRFALQSAMEAGVIEKLPVEVLADIVHGALNEGAMTVARTEDAAAARAQVGATIDRLLEGLRVQGPAKTS